MRAANEADRTVELLRTWAGPVRVGGRELDDGSDLVLHVGRRRFVVQFKRDSTPAAISAAARHTKRIARTTTALLVVPYMTAGAAERCRALGLSWLDLSGNADIRSAGLRVLIAGQPNQYKRRGRPRTAFAPRSARVTRLLLQRPDVSLSQAELARQAELDPGLVSRVVGRLVEQDLVRRDSDGVHVRDRGLLLDAWHDDYDLFAHDVLRVHVPARSPEELVTRLQRTIPASRRLAFTGLGAAWRLDHFATHRLVTAYVDRPLDRKLWESLDLRDDGPGANLWLVVPNDDGVFHGGAEVDGVPCVHPVQVYLDLKGHPERATEAAEHLRDNVLDLGGARGR